MTTSKLSREVHFIDVPDATGFEGRFVYNFFVPEEGVDAQAGVSAELLSKPGEYFDAHVVDYLGSARAPRYVVFTWKQATFRDRVYGQSPYRQDQPVPRNYIRDNLARVLSEEHFASEEFTGMSFTDQSIDRKLYSYISSSAAVLLVDRPDMDNQRTMAQKLNQLTSAEVDYGFLSTYSTQPTEEQAYYYDSAAQRIRNDAVNKLKDFNMRAQINNAVFHSLVKRAIAYPEGTFSSAHLGLYEISKRAQGKAQARGLRELRSDDYRTVAPDYVSLQTMKAGDAGLASRARLVGYIIDRAELKTDGTLVPLEPLVVEDPASSVAIDLRVRYYGRYQYTLRTVAEFTMPSIVEETGELVVAKFLISSRPTRPVLIDCRELVPPPPPSDIKFTWDWERDKMVVTWSFPPNSQRDVKQFQVFRRRNVQEPFQLVKQISFDDSKVPGPYAEEPDPRLVERVSNPKLFWIDDEFERTSEFIYTVGTVDAHGMVSQYGAQERVKFDRYKNRLIVRRVSQPGAPKPYPNMFLDADAFKDSIVEKEKRTMTVSFEPEHLELHDTAGRDVKFLRTSADGSSYKVLAISTELGVSQTLEIVIDDKRRTASKKQANNLAIPDYGNRVAKGG